MSRWQVIGLFLWRGGLLLAAAATFYYGSGWLITQYLTELPAPLLSGLSLAAAGLAMVFLSLILERLANAGGDRTLREE